jgi:homogentisate 1,2-dioxygenase
MLERLARGFLPNKPHTQLMVSGELCYEHCVTRNGFEGPFTIQYHVHPPQGGTISASDLAWPKPAPSERERDELQRLHFPMSQSASLIPTGDTLSARTPLLFNRDVVLSRVHPSTSDMRYFCDADADRLLFIHKGQGRLLSAFGELKYNARDYVFIPKGMVHRFEVEGEQQWLELALSSELGIPSHYRNAVGQLRLDAPYSHRDFRVSTFLGPVDEGIRTVIVKRGERLHLTQRSHGPLDVVGYDGTLYPFAFPIVAFQPKVSSVHLPPPVHATFSARGVLVCSFVPRPLDFGAGAIPCPYPHSSLDVDEVLFYAEGEFTSRVGISAGSISLHPRGIPHGPQPGRYEGSVGKSYTQELAVMLDCTEPLQLTEAAVACADVSYATSFGDAD